MPPDKVTVIPEAADERFHKIEDQSAVQRVLHRYGIGFDYILYVGEISDRKNIIRLLQAYHLLKEKDQLRQRRLVLVGKRTIDTEKIVSEMKRLGLESYVLFTGYVPDEDLPFLYNGASVFVFPSLYEGFGIPPLEAMQCQVPVVASSATSIPEVVGSGALLFNPYNVDDIAEKIGQGSGWKDGHRCASSSGFETGRSVHVGEAQRKERLLSWKVLIRECRDKYFSVSTMTAKKDSGIELISILVCSRGRRSSLEELTLNLRKMHTSYRTEVVVLEETDNPSPINGVHYISHPIANRGFPYARNLAVAHASGNILVFLDDDCVISDGWLDHLLSPLRTPRL